VVFYVLAMVCAGAVLPSPLSYLLATMATVLFGAVAVLQAAAPSLYHPLALNLSGQYFYRWPFVGLEVGVLAVAAHASVWLTAVLSSHIRAPEEQILRSREVLAMSEALRKNQRDMAQREKMIAIGTMAAGIAHEIGNPVASLSAVVQLLKRRHRSDEDSHHLSTLQEQVERIAKIVRQMLEFSRPAAGNSVLADLDTLIEQTVTMVGYSHRARHASIVSVRNRQLPKLRIAPQLFQQVLVNLLLNAFDAVEGTSGENVVTVERAVEEGWVKVMVKDRGVGMSEDQIRQAFEPFYTTKPPGKGTGLGLAVSYRLVERQGGRIKIESSPGAGTVVTVAFRVDRPAVGSVSASGAEQVQGNA